MKMLKAKLYELEVNKRNAAAKVLEDSKSDVSWGNQIRSYVLDQSRIKDLRTGVEIGNTDDGARRRPRPFIEASLKAGTVSERDNRVSSAGATRADENHLIAERRAKLDARCASRASPFPNDFRRDALAERAAGRATATQRPSGSRRSPIARDASPAA